MSSHAIGQVTSTADGEGRESSVRQEAIKSPQEDAVRADGDRLRNRPRVLREVAESGRRPSAAAS